MTSMRLSALPLVTPAITTAAAPATTTSFFVRTSVPQTQSAAISSRQTWLCGKRRKCIGRLKIEDGDGVQMFGSDAETATRVPSQSETLKDSSETVTVEYKPAPDVDYLQELLAIQQQGPRAIGFFGTRNMGFMHQELIEILSYAMVITKNHIFTSGASGTNAAVIRGALRAEKPELLTVILPQSLKKQPPESQELLAKVKNVIEKPHYDHLPLVEASRVIVLASDNRELLGASSGRGSVIWILYLTCSKLFALPSMTANCLWKPVKKLRISGRS